MEDNIFYLHTQIYYSEKKNLPQKSLTKFLIMSTSGEGRKEWGE